MSEGGAHQAKNAQVPTAYFGPKKNSVAQPPPAVQIFNARVTQPPVCSVCNSVLFLDEGCGRMGCAFSLQSDSWSHSRPLAVQVSLVSGPIRQLTRSAPCTDAGSLKFVRIKKRTRKHQLNVGSTAALGCARPSQGTHRLPPGRLECTRRVPQKICSFHMATLSGTSPSVWSFKLSSACSGNSHSRGRLCYHLLETVDTHVDPPGRRFPQRVILTPGVGGRIGSAAARVSQQGIHNKGPGTAGAAVLPALLSVNPSPRLHPSSIMLLRFRPRSGRRHTWPAWRLLAVCKDKGSGRNARASRTLERNRNALRVPALLSLSHSQTHAASRQTRARHHRSPGEHH